MRATATVAPIIPQMAVQSRTRRGVWPPVLEEALIAVFSCSSSSSSSSSNSRAFLPDRFDDEDDDDHDDDWGARRAPGLGAILSRFGALDAPRPAG